MFWTKLAKKSFFPSKIQNENTTIELCDCDFLDQICAKNVFPVSNRNNEDDHWILFIRIGLGTNLQLKLTILTFFIQIWPKWCFPSKTGEMNTAIQFCIMELVYGPNFRWNWHPPKKTVSGLKQKKWKPALNFACSSY